MREVTRFPHFHQNENIVTNHVMVMLRSLYDSSPRLFEEFLRGICQDEITVGPRFQQQIAGESSVPDGLVLQEPFAVFIETKLGMSLNADQLMRHCETISQRLPAQRGSFLLSLTAASTAQIPAPVNELAQQRGIQVRSVSFEGLIDQLATLQPNDTNLRGVIQEFGEFIHAQGLIPRQAQTLVAMLAGTSFNENTEFGIFFEPAERVCKTTRARFMGLYRNRAISRVGRIVVAVCAVRQAGGELAFDAPEYGEPVSDKQKTAIGHVIEAVQGYYPEFERSKHRFYIVDEFSATDFKKGSSGSMRGHRYFDIERETGKRAAPTSSGAEVATLLRGHTFE